MSISLRCCSAAGPDNGVCCVGSIGLHADYTGDDVSVSGVAIKPAETVKSLGVVLDRRLTFDQQVNNVCQACYFHIRALRHVRCSLPDVVAKTVACSIVSTRLDYCNGLYAGMTSANITKLQRVQNTLAPRLGSFYDRGSSIT